MHKAKEAETLSALQERDFYRLIADSAYDWMYPQEAQSAAQEKAPGATEKLLVCEDEPAVLRLISRLLETAGYSVTGARDGEEALRIFNERGARSTSLSSMCSCRRGEAVW